MKKHILEKTQMTLKILDEKLLVQYIFPLTKIFTHLLQTIINFISTFVAGTRFTSVWFLLSGEKQEKGVKKIKTRTFLFFLQTIQEMELF